MIKVISLCSNFEKSKFLKNWHGDLYILMHHIIKNIFKNILLKVLFFFQKNISSLSYILIYFLSVFRSPESFAKAKFCSYGYATVEETGIKSHNIFLGQLFCSKCCINLKFKKCRVLYTFKTKMKIIRTAYIHILQEYGCMKMVFQLQVHIALSVVLHPRIITTWQLNCLIYQRHSVEARYSGSEVSLHRQKYDYSRNH